MLHNTSVILFFAELHEHTRPLAEVVSHLFRDLISECGIERQRQYYFGIHDAKLNKTSLNHVYN